MCKLHCSVSEVRSALPEFVHEVRSVFRFRFEHGVHIDLRRHLEQYEFATNIFSYVVRLLDRRNERAFNGFGCEAFREIVSEVVEQTEH